MTTIEPVKTRMSQRRVVDALVNSWPLVVGLCALAIPAIRILADETWSHEDGAHGPLVLFVAAWLLWRQWPALQRQAVPGRGWLVAAILAPSLLLYILGEALDLVTLVAAGLYGVGAGIFYSKFGARALRQNWFIFAFLLFAVPLPSFFVDALTSPLKQIVSICATGLLRLFGIPVVHQGVVIYVAQYQLLVEDACAGLNSIVGLLAITVLYIYLVRGSAWPYALFLCCIALPVAVVANIVRIAILILLTYYAGEAAAQGFLHFAAGILVFIVALALVFLIDSVVFGMTSHRARRA